MMTNGKSDQLMSEINVTPFVDVMLVLLVIFMVTAPMMTEGVNVSLPQATSEPLATNDEELIVSIDQQGQIFINDFKVDIDFLQEKLKEIIALKKGKGVFIRADKNIPYGTVIKVMAEIKQAGVEKIGMVTEPLPETHKIKG